MALGLIWKTEPRGWVAQTQGAEAKLRGLVEQLRGAYRQSFQVEVFDARQEILRTIQQDDFTEERFENLLQVPREGFQKRFNRPYQGQSELLLESTAEASTAMATNEKDLQEEVAMMAKSFQQLTSRRDALLTAIKTAQSNDSLAIKPRTSVNG
jgi:flagellar biosynthesis protein FlhG